MAPKSSFLDAAGPRTLLSRRRTPPRTLHAQSCPSASDQSSCIHRRAGLLARHGWPARRRRQGERRSRVTTALGARSAAAEAVVAFRWPRRPSARAGSAAIARAPQSPDCARAPPPCSLPEHLQVLRQVDALDCSVRRPPNHCRTASPAYSTRVAAPERAPLPCGPASRRRASSASRHHVPSCAGLRREYDRLCTPLHPVGRRKSPPHLRRSQRR